MGPLIVVSGPSGSGKSTLITRLLDEARWPLRLSVSVTTRTPRPGEIDGKHYFFWSKDAFVAEIDAGGFLEWAEVFGNYYGTLEREVKPYREQGMGVLLEIDVKGWEQVRRRCPDAVSIFVRTSRSDSVELERLEQRLRGRRTESEASLKRRLEGARSELARSDAYHYQVINDDLDRAVAELRGLLNPLFERKSDAG